MITPLLLTLLAAPDISGIAACGEIIQGQNCLLLTFDGTQFFYLEDPQGYQPGQRVWVQGTYGSASVACDPRATEIIFGDSLILPDCPVDVLCSCAVTSACGNVGGSTNESYGQGCANSASSDGASLRISYGTWDMSYSADALGLTLARMPADASTFLFVADGRDRRTVGDGLLCVGSSAGRIHRMVPRSAGSSGQLRIDSFFSTLRGEAPASNAWVMPGATLYVQALYRDATGPCGSGFNLTNALALTPTP